MANRFLKRVRDFATVLGDGIIDRDVSLMSLKRMDVDALGLDELDRSLLRAIIEMYNGGLWVWKRWRRRWARRP